MQQARQASSPTRRGVEHVLVVGAGATTIVILLVALLAWPAGTAQAQVGGNGTVVHDTSPQFSAVCTVLPGVTAAPSLSGTIVSPVNNGEIRLRATVEDYFDGSEIDATQWITGASYPNDPVYSNEAPIVGSGMLTLYGSYLRSQTVFTGTQSPRFFEASAQFASALPPGDSDIGFYREDPPLQVVQPDPDALRLFIAQQGNYTSQPDVARMLYVRSRDGDNLTQYLFDTAVDNWGEDEDVQRANLSVMHLYRIDWQNDTTNYLIDGSQVITYVAPQAPTAEPGGSGIGGFVNVPLPHTGVTTRATYVFLYAQDPIDQGRSPLTVDWVRAGQYPASGSYTSCAQDAGQIANWSQATITATLPVSTGVQLATRTSVDGVTWSAWANVAGSVISGTATLTPASPSGRYLQYRLTLTSSDPLDSPEVGALTFSHFGPASLAIAPAATTLDPGATQQFAATVRDANSSVIFGAPVAWTAASGGAIDGGGLFSAGLPAGVFTDTVRATTSNNISNTATVTIRDLPPIASAGGPYTGQEGQPVALDASASFDPNGGALAFAWDLDNDGQFDDAAGATPSASWGDEGIYTIGVRVTDSGNLTGTATTTVNVANGAPQITSVTNSGPVRRSQPVTVTVTATDVPADLLTYSFDWTSDGVFDIVDQPASSAATSYPNTGVYTVTVRVRDGDGGEATATSAVTVTPQLLSATAANSGPVRRSQPVTVTVSGAQELSDPLTYGFDFDNDGVFEVVQAGDTAVTSFAGTGVKTVNFGVADIDGAVVTGTNAVTVTPQVLTIAAVSNDGPVLRNQQVTVIVTATQELSDALRYSFDWEDDGVYEVVDQPGNSASSSYPSIGNRVVRVRVRDTDGGEVSGMTTVEVAAQTIQITAVNSDAPKRREQPVTVNVVAVQQLSDELLYSFDWNNDGIYDVVDQTASSASTSYATTGDKAIRVRVRDQQNSEASQTTTVQIVAQNLVISEVKNSGPVRRGQSVQVTVSAVQDLSDALLYSFDWDADGSYDVVDSPANSASTSFATSGSKTVRVYVRDTQGGTAAGETVVQVNQQALTIETIENSGPVDAGKPVTITVSATQELSDPLSYSFDWEGDGLFDIVEQAAPVATTVYNREGVYQAVVRVRDAQGSETSATTVVEVIGVGGTGEPGKLYLPTVMK